MRDASGKLALIEANDLANEELDLVQQGIEEGWFEGKIEAALAGGARRRGTDLVVVELVERTGADYGEGADLVCSACPSTSRASTYSPEIRRPG